MKTFIRIIAVIVMFLFLIVSAVMFMIDNEVVWLMWACMAGLWGITLYLDIIRERDLKGGYR